MENINLKCSVAIGTYNGEKYIIEQLRSIENQTVIPDEIIIFDDGSTDDTVKLIKEYIKTSKMNFSLNVNEKNLGCRRNYEQIYSACTNDIVFLCDQDDVWFSNKVEIFLEEFQKDENLVYAFSNAYVTDENLNITNESEWSIDWTKYDRQGFFDYVQTRNFPLGFQGAVRKSFLHQIFPLMSDPDGWIAQCAAVFGNIKAIPEKLVYYRRHSQATSGAHRTQKSGYGALIKKILTTKYQVYFTYPNAELLTYGRILEYAEREKGVHTEEIRKHIVYLNTLKDIEGKNMFVRLKQIKSLIDNNIYCHYRGNKKTYMLDCVFLIVNSFKRKSKR